MVFPEAVRSFMDKPSIARISVIDDQGYPHLIPIWFARDGDELVFFSSRTARKIKHVQSNSKGAVTIGGDPYGSEGYTMKGDFFIQEDDQHRWLREITYRYEPRQLADAYLAEWMHDDLVVMRFKPKQVIRV